MRGRWCFCENAQSCSSGLSGSSHEVLCSGSFTCSFPVGGEANQQFAQENIFTVQHIGYQMCNYKMPGPLLGRYLGFTYHSLDSGSTDAIWFSQSFLLLCVCLGLRWVARASDCKNQIGCSYLCFQQQGQTLPFAVPAGQRVMNVCGNIS